MPFCYQKTGKLKSHYAKKTSSCLWKLLSVLEMLMMTFDPKYSFESPFANIWENNLFESDSWSFDLIKKKDFRSSDPFSRLFPTELTTKSLFFQSQCEIDPLLAKFIKKKKIYSKKILINSQYLFIYFYICTKVLVFW